MSDVELLEGKPRADRPEQPIEERTHQLGRPKDSKWDDNGTTNGRHRLGKDRLGKDRLGKDSIGEDIKENIIKENTLSSSEKPDNDLPLEAIKKKPAKITNPDIKTFIDFFTTEYQNHTGKKYIVSGSKEGSIIKRLLANLKLEELKELAGRFFESDDKFIQKAGYTLGVFSSVINKLNAVEPEESIYDEPTRKHKQECEEWERVKEEEEKRKQKEQEAADNFLTEENGTA